jgi:glycosyltransferase involved in cell wall biosynthesis
VTILFLISSEGHYGIENMLVVLARNLSRLGCRSIVGVFRDSRFPHTEVGEEAQKQGLTVEVVPCNGRLDWSAVTQIRRLLVKYDVDILHPHGYKADLYAYAVARRSRVSLLATSHNWPNKKFSMRVYAALDRLALRRFDRVVAVSEPVKDTLLRWAGPRERIAVIFNGVDVEHFRLAAPTMKREIALADHSVVGFVGRFTRDKGGALLLRAAQQVLAIHPNTTFALVGDGPSRGEWQTLARELGIADHVIFTGVRNDMPGVYASLDVVVLPSLVESMPMCLLEAMAAGKAVIATRVGAVPKLVIPEQTGLLLARGDQDELAAAIVRLLVNSELADRLGENGCAHVSANFSAEAMARQYIGQYQLVLAGSRPKLHNRAAAQVS